MTQILLPPSRAARRVVCPGSRALEALYPATEESESAREGRIAHECITYLRHGHNLFLEAGHETPEGDIFTQDMIDGACLFLNAIDETVTPAHHSLKDVNFELPLTIAKVHDQCVGVPDAWYYDQGVLFIWEYKYGFKPIDAFENWQMIEYAIGIISALEFNGQEVRHIYFEVIQPRNYVTGPNIIWEISAEDFATYEKQLCLSENVSLQPTAYCNPSPQCIDCRARHACPALQQAALTVIDTSMENLPLDLTPAAIGNELRFLKRAEKLLDARITGLEEQALSLIKRGENVPYFRVEESAGRERWKQDNAEIIALGDLLGVDVSKPVEVVTPKQAIKAGLPAEVVREYSETPRGSLKLVSDNAARIFGVK